MRADLESGLDSRCERPGFLVDSVDIRRFNVTEDPFVPVFDCRFYIFTLRGVDCRVLGQTNDMQGGGADIARPTLG